MPKANRVHSTPRTTASDFPIAANRDLYGDLEKPIIDVRNMAAIVAQVMEQEAGLEAGDVTISARSWETFSFAVYHLMELIDGLHSQYFRD